MFGALRQFLGYRVTIGELFVVALILGTPYLIVGATWSSTHTEHLERMTWIGEPLHHYHHRAFYIGVLSVILIVVGLLALNFPVFIDAYDQCGLQIKCGTGFSSDLTQAAEASGGRLRRSMRDGGDAAPDLGDSGGGDRVDCARRRGSRGGHRLGPRIGVRRRPGRLT